MTPFIVSKRTNTSAGLECVIQEQSSFRTQLCVLHTFQESTSPLDNTSDKRVFLHEGLSSLTIKGHARARALNV